MTNEQNNDSINILEEHTDYEFVKNNENDVIFWIDNVDAKGEHLFSFDKKKIYNLFADYPYKLTNTEREIFDNENEYWKEFFSDRN